MPDKIRIFLLCSVFITAITIHLKKYPFYNRILGQF